jgi:hypothetical protein
MVEQEGHGVREDFAQQSAYQMPEVARPHLLYGIALCELAEDGVYPVAKPALRNALLFGVGSLFLEEYGARSSTPMPANNSWPVLGEW